MSEIILRWDWPELVRPPEDTRFPGNRFYQFSHFVMAASFLEDKKRVALDVGAHIGTITRYLLVNFDKVIAIEARADLLPYLKKNCSRISDNRTGLLEVINAAASDRFGRCRIREERSGNSGSGIIVPGNNVDLITIDSLAMDALDFLKIDVQGHEEQVLRGAKRTLEKHQPVIWLEGPPGCMAEQYLYEMGAKQSARCGNNFVMGWNKLINKVHFRTPPSGKPRTANI